MSDLEDGQATSRTDRSRTNPSLAIVVLLGVACYLRIGYGYGIGDHEELLPQLLRALDPSLFPTDPYLLAEDDAFSVRFVWLGLLRLTCLVVPAPVAVFGWTVVSWLGVSWAAWRLAHAVVENRVAATLAVLATLATVHWVPGGNALISRTLVPESLAWIPCLLALEAFARDRVWRSAMLLGVTMWIQPLIGLQVGLLLGLVGLWRMADGEPRQALGRAVGFGALAVAGGSPIWIPTLLTQSGTAPPADGLPTFFVTAQLRQAHHYLLFAQSPVALARFGVVVAIGLAGLAVLRRRPRGRVPEPHRRHGRADRFATRTVAVIAVLVGLYVIGTEGFQSLTVAKMQFFRLTLVAKLFLLAWASAAAVALVPARWRRVLEDAQASRMVTGGLAVTALGLTLGLAALEVGRPHEMWYPAQHRATDVYRAEAWIAENTPRDALFLVPPGTTTFRSHALRSVAVNFKPTTFRDDAMHRWLARLRVVAPAPLPDLDARRQGVMAWREALDPAYHATSDWDALADYFDADHALIDLEAAPTPPRGRPLFVSGSWAVFDLEDAGSRE
ncbi:DUF6798 domain-containing protein [Rubrivirga sp.]|uniref:DUF6798 domain-containing protein n=1 Tax=Rubrivirga sp. TaxID=1885344 RepID=UPI003C782DCE